MKRLAVLLLIFRGFFAGCYIALLILLSRSAQPQEAASLGRAIPVVLVASLTPAAFSGGRPSDGSPFGVLILLSMSVRAEGQVWLEWPLVAAFLGTLVVWTYARGWTRRDTGTGPSGEGKAKLPGQRAPMVGKGFAVLVLVIGVVTTGYGVVFVVLSRSGQVEGLGWLAALITVLGLILFGLGLRLKRRPEDSPR